MTAWSWWSYACGVLTPVVSVLVGSVVVVRYDQRKLRRIRREEA